MGQGALYSAIAIALYGLMVIMGCRLPKDDPHGLCCRKKNKNESGRTFLGSQNSSAGDDKPERSWLSDDKKNAAADEEDGII